MISRSRSRSMVETRPIHMRLDPSARRLVDVVACAALRKGKTSVRTALALSARISYGVHGGRVSGRLYVREYNRGGVARCGAACIVYIVRSAGSGNVGHELEDGPERRAGDDGQREVVVQ
jgi:hypothetical protein